MQNKHAPEPTRPLMAEVLQVSPTCKRVTCSELPGWKHGTPSTRALRILAWNMAVDGWELLETYSTVEFSMIYAGRLVLCKVPQEYGNKVVVWVSDICFLFDPMWFRKPSQLHNSKLCFAGFRHVFLYQPLLREDLSTTYLTTMFQIETTEWYCNSFKLCNKLFCFGFQSSW